MSFELRFTPEAEEMQRCECGKYPCPKELQSETPIVANQTKNSIFVLDNELVKYKIIFFEIPKNTQEGCVIARNEAMI